MLPTLRQLQYLKLLAEHGSFSRAAEAAFVSQPALSAGVQELEKILGAQVVERTRGGVQLTAVGAEAVRRAEDVLARTEDLVEAAQSAGRPLSGRFRLGVIPTVAPFLLPAKLPGVKAAWPALKLFIREDLTPGLIKALKAGQLDAAVIALPYSATGIDHARIGDDEILAAAPAGHPLAAPGPIQPGRRSTPTQPDLRCFLPLRAEPLQRHRSVTPVCPVGQPYPRMLPKQAMQTSPERQCC